MSNPKIPPAAVVTVRHSVPDFTPKAVPQPVPGTGPLTSPNRRRPDLSEGKEPSMSEVFTAITLDRIESLLDANGVVIRQEHFGDRSFLKFNSGPFMVLIFPYGVEPEFVSLQFHASFRAQPTLDVINTWNKENRYGKTYLDGEGDPVLEYDLDLEGGATDETILEAVRTFRMLVRDFAGLVLEAE